jgi:hypothetical protein
MLSNSLETAKLTLFLVKLLKISREEEEGTAADTSGEAVDPPAATEDLDVLPTPLEDVPLNSEEEEPFLLGDVELHT